ncbi:MAG: hypothetical protein RL557_1052 [archaeon]|jgi:hypothetical protein
MEDPHTRFFERTGISLQNMLAEAVEGLDDLHGLEDDHHIKDLRLTSLIFDSRGNLVISYDTIASEKSYPNLTELLQRTISKKGRILSKTTVNPQREYEYEQVQMGFRDDNVRIFFSVYNPQYQGEK